MFTIQTCRQVATLPSELRGKKEQSLPVGLFNPGSSNLSRLVKKSGDYQKHPRCKRNLTFDLDLEQSKPQIQIYQKHPKCETGQTGRQVRGAEGTWRGPWGSRPEQCWPHHCWGINICIGVCIGVNKQYTFSTSTTSVRWNGRSILPCGTTNQWQQRCALVRSYKWGWWCQIIWSYMLIWIWSYIWSYAHMIILTWRC